MAGKVKTREFVSEVSAMAVCVVCLSRDSARTACPLRLKETVRTVLADNARGAKKRDTFPASLPLGALSLKYPQESLTTLEKTPRLLGLNSTCSWSGC